ncbi:MAG: MFS transporter [Pseudomonadota bacterium]
MQSKNLVIALTTTFFTFCTLYLPQPLLPLLSAEFNTTADTAALLVSVPMLILGIAPLAFGFPLSTVPSQRLLIAAVPILAITNLCAFWMQQFDLVLLLRAAHGVLLSVIFTALMSYIASISLASHVRQNMALYIATTILGGFCGRAFSGLVATWWDWRLSFVCLGAALLMNTLLLLFIGRSDAPSHHSASISDYKAIFENGVQRSALLTIFLFFCTFSALLNTLPFRMVNLVPGISEFSISIVYSGYLVGILIAVYSTRLVARLDGISRTIALVFAAYIVSLCLFWIPNPTPFLLFMLVASGCFFLLHAILSGSVNAHASGQGGIVNSLYIASYYAGGSLGAWLAPLIFRHFGWDVMISALCVTAGCAYFASWQLRHADPLPSRRA